MVRAALLAAVVLLVSCAVGSRFGVPVYPGAKYDALTTKVLKETMGFNGECFQTSDSVRQVAEFYREKGLRPFGETTKESALFRKGNVDVTMQSPWMNMKTGAIMKNTLISIVKQSE